MQPPENAFQRAVDERENLMINSSVGKQNQTNIIKKYSGIDQILFISLGRKLEHERDPRGLTYE